MKRLFFFIPVVFLANSVCPQNPLSVFNRHREIIPTEHIYLHFDKHAYVAGETIWFSGHVYAPGNEGPVSTNFFAELLNEKEEVIYSARLPVTDDKAIAGQFELPAEITQGIYLVRAWTNQTKNLDPAFVFKKAIPVFNAASLTTTGLSSSAKGYSFEWYPEGGKYIAGTPTTIAFRATDPQYEPAVVSGTLIDGKGKDLGSFSTNKYGYGFITYEFSKGEKYFAELQFPDKSVQKIELPAIAEKDVVLYVLDHELGKEYSIMVSPELSSKITEVQLLAVMDDDVVLKTKITLENGYAHQVINTQKLRAGALKILLFDTENNLLVQRSTYVAGTNTDPELNTVVKNISPKGKNEWVFVFPEPLQGIFSVSVSDADRELLTSGDDIKSVLLVQSGSGQHTGLLKNANDETKDLAIMASKRFGDNWPAFAAMKPQEMYDDLHLPLKGILYEQGKNKIITEGVINFLVKIKDSSGMTYQAPVEKNGSFKLNNLIYEDTARIYYGWKSNDQKKPAAAADIELGTENLNFSSLLSPISYESFVLPYKKLFYDSSKLSLASLLLNQTSFPQKNKILAAVSTQTVKGKTANSNSEANKRYTSGVFASTGNVKMMDFINEPPTGRSGNIFDYITGRIGGLTIEKEKGLQYSLYSGRSTSTLEAIQDRSTQVVQRQGQPARTPQDYSKSGRIPGKVYLNEQEVTSDAIARIQLEEIALVKYFPPGTIMVPGIGLAGLLAVYTKKPEDMEENEAKYFNSFIFPGYSPAKKFISPDYTTDDNKKPDHRTTLYWNPDIRMDNSSNEIKISFFNNDTAKRIRVVLEGITTDGRLVSFEKIIE